LDLKLGEFKKRNEFV